MTSVQVFRIRITYTNNTNFFQDNYDSSLTSDDSSLCSELSEVASDVSLSDSDSSSTSSIGSSSITAFGGLTAPTSVTASAAMTDGTYIIHDDTAAWSFSESYTYGDAVDADGTTVTFDVYATDAGADANNYGNVEALPAFGQVTTTAGGQAAGLAGTIKSDGTITLTAGGAGTTATGQFVSEVTIR